MKFVNPIFNTKKVRQFVADLIIDYDYDDFSDLSNSEKCEFAALLMEAAGRGGEYECITESNHLDQTAGYLRAVLRSDKEADENLLYHLKDEAIRYYADTMQSLFDDGFTNFQQERNEWLDYTAKHGDPDEAYDRYREGLA